MAFLLVIVDTTDEEEECHATEKGQENSTEELRKTTLEDVLDRSENEGKAIQRQ